VIELKEKLKAAQMESARLTTERDHSRKLAERLNKKLKETATLGEVPPSSCHFTASKWAIISLIIRRSARSCSSVC